MKKRIRLTESQLNRVIEETVYQILSEGKVVNNKPYFSEFYSSREPTKRKIKSGRKIDCYGYSDWDLEGNAKERGIEKYSPEYYELAKAMQKHNDRIENYKLNGHRYSDSNDKYATLWGSKECEDELLKDRKQARLRKLGYVDDDDDNVLYYQALLRAGYDFDHSTM